MLLVVGAAGLFGCGGCSPDVFDVDVDLATETYDLDFGAVPGTLPAIDCDPGLPGVCDGAQSLSVNASSLGAPVNVDLSAGCDAGTGRCYARASARVFYTANVLQDDAFTTKIARRGISLVRVGDLVYTTPVNTLTFDVPQIDIYVGPAGSTRETDPDVVPVGSTVPLAASTTLTSEQHLAVADGSAARAAIEDDIRNRRPFTFVLVLAPQLEGGDPIPAGQLEVDVTPHLLIGLAP